MHETKIQMSKKKKFFLEKLDQEQPATFTVKLLAISFKFKFLNIKLKKCQAQINLLHKYPVQGVTMLLTQFLFVTSHIYNMFVNLIHVLWHRLHVVTLDINVLFVEEHFITESKILDVIN
jgi:hypothetical protein